jgi:hypothetical protein
MQVQIIENINIVSCERLTLGQLVSRNKLDDSTR